MALHGLKGSCESTGDLVVVDLSWLIGVTREEDGKCSSTVEDESFYWRGESCGRAVAFGP